MYVVKNWNEEVIKWLAVAMCLAMVGMAVMPAVKVGDIGYGIIWYVENVMKKKVDGGAAAGVLAGTTAAGMTVGAYIAVEAAKEGAEIGLVTAGIIGAAVGAVAGFL